MEEFIFPEDENYIGEYILDTQNYDILPEVEEEHKNEEEQKKEEESEKKPEKTEKNDKKIKHALFQSHKKIVHPPKDVPSERRKTVFELDSFFSTIRKSVLSFDTSKSSDSDEDQEQMFLSGAKLQATSVAGKVRIKLSPLTQKIIGCVIGENLTEEYPWIEVNKQIIEDNIYLHPESSDFLPVAFEILSFPDDKILLGYDPQIKEESQFLICVTEEARDVVIRNIEAVRLERESRVRNAVNKKPYPWESLGSENDMESNLDDTRERLTVEHQINIEFPQRRMNFSDRTSDDHRNCYVELQPIHTETFENVEKQLLSVSVQNCPDLRENQTQMTVHSLVDGSSQYSIDDLPTYIVSDKKYKSDMIIIAKKLKDFDTILSKQNSSWDIYTDDYKKLVLHE